MGSVVKSIFGGGSSKTKVEYKYPSEVSAQLERLVQLSKQLERMIPSLSPQLSEIYSNLYQQLSPVPSALGSVAGSYADVLENLRASFEQQMSNFLQSYPSQVESIESKRTQKLSKLYDTTTSDIRKEVAKVKEDVLRNLYRDLSMQGLLSSRSATEAVSEKFRQLELEPVLSNIMQKEKALTGLQSTTTSMLYDYLSKLPQYYSTLAGFGKDIETLRASAVTDYLKQLPQLYSSLAEIQAQQTMVPWNLIKEIMGAITGIGQLAGGTATPVVRTPQPGLLEQAMPFVTAFGIAKLFGSLF